MGRLIKTEFRNITAPIVGFIQKIIDKATAAAKTAITSIPSKIGGSIGGVPSAVSSAFGGVKSFLGGIPGFADGVQNFGGGPAVVGERGPELVNLPRGSSVTPMGRRHHRQHQLQRWRDYAGRGYRVRQQGAAGLAAGGERLDGRL